MSLTARLCRHFSSRCGTRPFTAPTDSHAHWRGGAVWWVILVVAIAHRPHGTDQPGLAHASAVGQRGVLAAVVGVVDYARVHLAVPDRHVQGLDYQLHGRPGAHGPPDHATAEGVEDDGQEREPGQAGDVREVGDPE